MKASLYEDHLEENEEPHSIENMIMRGCKEMFCKNKLCLKKIINLFNATVCAFENVFV